MDKYTWWCESPDVDSEYKNIDDVTPDEDTTYLWEDNGTISGCGSVSHSQGWFHNAWSSSNTIDSVRLVVRGRAQTFNVGTPQIIFGRTLVDGEGMFWPCSPIDTFIVNTSWGDSSITWSQDPCSEAPWTQSSLNDASYWWWFNSYTVGNFYDSFGQTSGATKYSLLINISLNRVQSDFTGIVDSIAIQYSDGNPVSNVKFAIYSDSGVTGYPYICLDSTASGTHGNGWENWHLPVVV